MLIKHDKGRGPEKNPEKLCPFDKPAKKKGKPLFWKKAFTRSKTCCM